MNFLAKLRSAPACRTSQPEGYLWEAPPLEVVFQFCHRDYNQALKVLKWSADLNKQPNTIHLVTDEGFRCDGAERIARASWKNVHIHRISPCNLGWPRSNNHAFVETCKIMKDGKSPWLLWETDMIPTRKDWLQQLEKEYAIAKKPFMGAWVDSYDLMNGGAIYPSDVMAWCPQFFNNHNAVAEGYDMAMAPEMVWFMHPANHMMPNIFNSRSNGRPSGLNSNVPVWTQEMFDWVCTHNVCIIHRDKSGDTIDFLRKRLGL